MSLKAFARITAAAVLVVGANCIAASPASVFVLTNADVKALAYQALTRSQQRLPQLSIEINPRRAGSRYTYVTAYWRGLPKGSAVVDNFAVDQLTGDVWSAATSCSEKKNPGLHKMQVRLRRKMDMSLREYRHLKTRGPLCDS